MNVLQARMFIEQILGQPSLRAAVLMVQSNAQSLDSMFFVTLQQMIQEEQEVGNPDGRVEKRPTDSSTPVQSPSAPSKRLQALRTLQSYAWQLTQPMALNSLLQPEQIAPSTSSPRSV